MGDIAACRERCASRMLESPPRECGWAAIYVGLRRFLLVKLGMIRILPEREIMLFLES